MKEENIKPIQVVDMVPPPSPIAERECKCGCGHKFTPNRRDKVYINSQHANYGYNHGKRKTKAKSEVSTQKGLRINDRVLEKHFKASKQKEAVCFLMILNADGFRQQYFIGYNIIDELGFYYSYNYVFHIYESEGHKLVKIRKR